MIRVYLGLLVAFAIISVKIPLQGLVGVVCMTSLLLRKHKLDEEKLQKRLLDQKQLNETFKQSIEQHLTTENKRRDAQYEQLVNDVKLAQQEAKDRIASIAIAKSYGSR